MSKTLRCNCVSNGNMGEKGTRREGNQEMDKESGADGGIEGGKESRKADRQAGWQDRSTCLDHQEGGKGERKELRATGQRKN